MHIARFCMAFDGLRNLGLREQGALNTINTGPAIDHVKDET